MNRKLTLVGGLFAVAMMFTAMMSANAQDATPFPPEATAMPDGAVYAAQGHCAVSPDETQMILNGYAVLDLNTGEKLYDFEGQGAVYNADARYFSTHDGAVYDSSNGELVIPVGQYEANFIPSRDFSPDGLLFVNSDGVYRLETREMLMPLNTAETLATSTQIGITFLPSGDLQVLRGDLVEGRDYFQHWIAIYNAQTFEMMFDSRDYVEQLVLSPRLSADMTRFVLADGGIFSYPEMELLTDFSDPKYDVGNEIWVGENSDSTQFAILGLTNKPDTPSAFVVQVIDFNTGDILHHFEAPYGDGSLPNSINEFLRDVDFGRTPSQANPFLYRVGNRYIELISGDVFDATTEELVFDVPNGGQNPRLTAGGSYVVTQPCTVWRLP